MSRTTRTNYHKLLLIFIHGYKGDDHTFKDFPARLQIALTETVQSIEANSIIYPRYETRGDLKKAVEMFCLWLEGVVQEQKRELNGEGDVWVCLFGHSMGGILASDAIIYYANQTETIPPKIIGLLAFDTPYYGVDKNVFQKAAFERADKMKQNFSGIYNFISNAAKTATAQDNTEKSENKPSPVPSSGWKKWGLAAGIAAASVAAGAAVYYNKDKVSQSTKYLESHLEYVRVLFNYTELSERVENLLKVQSFFHCYYTEIPQSDRYKKPRTFISLPPSDMVPYFSAIACKNDDEIDAHISIFNPNQTSSDLDNITLKKIIEIIEKQVS